MLQHQLGYEQLHTTVIPFVELFFRASSNTAYFGDCSCETQNPFASLDIIGHEIAHGVTHHTSGLFHEFQPGALAEGFADILGTVVEHRVNDRRDPPDFTIGENIGDVIRFMENPETNDIGIGSVCDYSDNLDSHSTCGVLDKAFVKSVRICALSGCSNTRGCVLLIGALFMYANVHRLTSLSNYNDAATATCDIVSEFLQARAPRTSCSREQITEFVREGWGAVHIILDEACVATWRDCNTVNDLQPIENAMGEIFGKVVADIGGLLGGLIDRILALFGYVPESARSSGSRSSDSGDK